MKMELCEKASWRMLSAFNTMWYFHVLREALIKYKVFSIFLICLIAPSVGFMLRTVTWPADIYLNSGRLSILNLGVVLIGVQLLSLACGLICKRVLTNRQWDGYMSSLPLPHGLRIASDSMVLTLANLLFLATVFYVYISHTVSLSLNFIEVSVRVIFIALMMCSIQSATIYKRNLNLLYSVLLGLVIVPSIMFMPILLEVLFLIAVSYLFHLNIKSIYGNQAKESQLSTFSHFAKLESCRPIWPLILLNAKVILDEPSAFIARLLPVVILQGLFFLLILDSDFILSASTCVLPLVLLLNMFFLSNIFKPIINKWGEYNVYISSLPLPRLTFLTSIISIPFFLGVPVNLFLIGGFFAFSAKSIHSIEISAYFFIPFIYLLYCFNMQIFLKRFGLLLSFVGLIPFYWIMMLLT